MAERNDFLTEEYMEKVDAYWRAANYLAAAQLYLLDNPLLREPLTMEHVKKNILLILIQMAVQALEVSQF